MGRVLAVADQKGGVAKTTTTHSLGMLPINGLTAADAVIIPRQCETLGHRGVGQLLGTTGDVRSFTNPNRTWLAVKWFA